MFTYRWRCKDRRYNIQVKGENTTATSITATCGWYNQFNLQPLDLECVLLYCDNATDYPLVNDLGYANIKYVNLTVYDPDNPGLIPLGDHIRYNCKNGYNYHDDKTWQVKAPSGVNVRCRNSSSNAGTLNYPDVWQQCFESITCPDPGSTEDLIRTEVDFMHTGNNHNYKSELNYVCADKRKFVKIDKPEEELKSNIISTCHWRQTYDILGPSLVCEIHHCAHPHNDDGAHPPPPPQNNISLVESTEVLASHVPFGEKVMYKCDDNTFIENTERDPTKNNITVTCNDFGMYDVPDWPNCTETVTCGPPPQPPINGSIIWLNGTEGEVYSH